jgi:RimJ/RimL family protein N-acetyltransferase
MRDMTMPELAPPLGSTRLTMRGHRITDLDECAAMWGDPEVTRHIGGRPFSEEEVWTKILRYVGHWSLLQFGYWVIRERASGRLVGEVGFANFHRQLEPPLGDAPELGWALARWAWGRGFATEAVRSVLAWADSQLAAERTVCLFDPENRASLRVADKCGYRPFARASYRGAPTLVWQRLRGGTVE